MPRAKRIEFQWLFNSWRAAERLGISPYILKARVADGLFPSPSTTGSTGVPLFDEAWIDRARSALTHGQGASRRSRRVAARPQVPSPADVLGFRPGTARRLPDWPDIVDYFERLAAASDRVVVEELGRTTQGNPYIVVAVSAAESLRPEARDRNRTLLSRLWDPRGVNDAEVEEAIREAKSVPIILATQHSNEIGAALMTLDLAHDLATREDPATREVRENSITLIVPSGNPDGIRIITEW